MTLYKPLQAVLAASTRFTNVSDEEIAELNISVVPKSTQYTTKYGVKILKGKAASLNLLVYFDNVTLNYKYNVMITKFLCFSALKLH